MKSVPIINARQAAAKVRSGDALLVGGFGMTGTPVHLLHALAETDTRNIAFIGNNIGESGLGGSRLLRNGQLSKMMGSFFTSNPEAVAAAQSGVIEAKLIPQGTFAEALRAGGAGIGGFFTPTSVDTQLAEGCEIRVINGRKMVFVEPIRGDIAFIRAWRADTAGNLQYRMTESNFNRAIATAAETVIAEVEEIVPTGEIHPDAIHTPGCFVDYLVQANVRLEHLGTSASIADSTKKTNPARMTMAAVALRQLRRGDVVNLGVGIPTLIADLISPDDGIILHSENGMLGMGPEPTTGGAMDFPVNAGKIPVTALPGASYFDSADSFAMIRGGHIDVAIMGGLQVDQHANLANWAAPNRPLLGVGGAMDLASGAKRLVVTMTHVNKDGASKVVENCDLPLTASGAVDLLITDLAVFEFDDGGMTLSALMPGSSVDTVRRHTVANYRTSDRLETIAAGFSRCAPS